MRGKVAKKLRKEVYGDLSLKDRKYFQHTKTGSVICDPLRRAYQTLKRRHKNGN